jgi:hypothetical protein
MERFLAAYGTPVKYEEVEPSLFERHSNLPTELLDEWEKHGFTVYKQGLLWITNPDEFEETVKSLFGERSTYRCVARNAFGDLVLFDKDDQWFYFDAYNLRATDYQADYYTLFDFMMSRKEWLRDMMLLKVYHKALRKYGPLQADQVYAFEPHPALGGTGEVDTLVKRRIFEYLEMLIQLME